MSDRETMTLQESYVFEATASKESIAAYYSNSNMRRRYRVEGTAAGNSRLVMKNHAKRLRLQYGGELVEVFKLRPLYERQALGLIECPFCKAMAGKPCASRNGKPRKPHAARWEASP